MQRRLADKPEWPLQTQLATIGDAAREHCGQEPVSLGPMALRGRKLRSLSAICFIDHPHPAPGHRTT
jgi:hypothetical protein